MCIFRIASGRSFKRRFRSRVNGRKTKTRNKQGVPASGAIRAPAIPNSPIDYEKHRVILFRFAVCACIRAICRFYKQGSGNWETDGNGLLGNGISTDSGFPATIRSRTVLLSGHFSHQKRDHFIRLWKSQASCL